MNKILFITSATERYYFEPFILACRDRNLDIYIFDPSRFPSEASVVLNSESNGKVSGFIDVEKCNLKNLETTSKTRIALEDVSVAWYLRPQAPIPRKLNTELEVRFAQTESRAVLETLYAVAPWRWINSRERIKAVESNKLYQQVIAEQSGLRTPRTLVSNDPSAIIKFAECENGLLLKTLGYTEIDKNEHLFIYSNCFTTNQLRESSEAIEECPVFAQEYIAKKYEYRVMCIGSQVLACQIDSQSSCMTRIDWRHYDFENVAHRQYELPDKVKANLLRFMTSINLKYGAIDLIETLDGNFVFLEVNPSGQWGWIADFAKLPIPEAVADMFESMFA